MAQRRSNFGTHHEEIWRQLARQVAGEFQTGGTWQADKVRMVAGDWSITLDVRTVPGYKTEERFTRLRAPFVNTEGFRFTIYRKNVFSRLAAFLGMEDLETGYSMVDDNYIVQASDKAKLRRLLSDEQIRILMEAQGDFYVHVHADEGFHADQYPDGVDELYFEVPDVINDFDRLKQCYDLFALLLRSLCHMESEYEKDPELTI
jgi:hypothetical protein